jgi:hypothetical protein
MTFIIKFGKNCLDLRNIRWKPGFCALEGVLFTTLFATVSYNSQWKDDDDKGKKKVKLPL